MIALDLHADAIQGFFDIPVDHLTAEKLLVEYIRKLHLPNAVIVSPDLGGAKRVGDVARLLHLPIAFVYKRRPKDDVVGEQRVDQPCHAERDPLGTLRGEGCGPSSSFSPWSRV